MWIASRAQMKQLDEQLLKNESMIELVDKASDCLFEEVKEFDHICIVCSGGNNGADGLALAMKLYHIQKKVHVYFCGTGFSSDAALFYYQQCQQAQLILSDQQQFLNEMKMCTCIVDAIFGIGCHCNPTGLWGEMIQQINASLAYVLSVDVVSGMDCDSGEVYENCVRASKTVTFFAYKLGFFHPDAQKMLGEICVKRLAVDVKEGEWLSEGVDHVHIQKKRYEGHKGIYGKSMLICGSVRYPGAAILSTQACVSTGCGISALCSTQEVLAALSIAVPEAIHLTREQINEIDHYQAALIGCGLESDEALLKWVLSKTTLPLVIDATSLNDLAKHLDWLENQKRPIMLTPHLGEFKRLCPDMNDPTLSAIAFARRYQVIVILKGPHTLITDGRVSYRVMSGNGAMACGGSGDVLAGILTSLLAQGYDALTCACAGVYLHGLAGDWVGQRAHTVMPSELIRQIPYVMKAMENM